MAKLQFQITRTAATADDRPTYGMGAGTQVLTLEGALPVEYLTPGDRVLTRSGLRRVVAVEMTRLAQARVAILAEGVLGSGRPESETMLLPGQPVLIRDWRAKALYGAAKALVPVARLADGEYIRLTTLAEVRIFTLRLDAEAVIYAGGLELACEAQVVTA